MANRRTIRHNGQHRVRYMGDVYIGWEVYYEPKTARYWYWNKMLKNAQYKFPTTIDEQIPTGWVVNSLGESGEFGRGEFAWWLNEEEKEAVKNHPEGPPCLERYKRYCERFIFYWNR